MEEIKVGEYIRTNKGEIHKVTFILYPDAPGVRYAGQYLYETYYECENNDGCRFDKYDILKHSPNIIDLIEPGDYVNGYKVYDISTEYLIDIHKDGKILYIEKEGFINATITEGEDDIKSICTKEQFAAAEYKI